MKRTVLALTAVLLAVALGFGAGWTVFEWRPWNGNDSQAATASNAEIELIKMHYGREANCKERRYPRGLFDCVAWKDASGNCYSGDYTLRRVNAASWDIEDSKTRSILSEGLPPPGC